MVSNISLPRPPIDVAGGFPDNGPLDDKLPLAVLQHATSFLSYGDRGPLTQAARFTLNASRHSEVQYTLNTERLKTKIAVLPAGWIPKPQFACLLIELLRSPAKGHPALWVPLMDRLMTHYPLSNVHDGIVEDHADIAQMLGAAEPPLDADQIYAFCDYLGKKQLSRTKIWAAYRALEKYLPLSPSTVERALYEFSLRKAQLLIVPQNCKFPLGDGQELEYYRTVIDSRDWFGFDYSTASLWVNSGIDDKSAPLPAVLREALFSHLLNLSAACAACPFMTEMVAEEGSTPPRNFLLPLAAKITEAGIFLEGGGRILDKYLLRKPYWSSVFSLQSEELEKLAEQYPGAIKAL